jgi:hypothetical protein
MRALRLSTLIGDKSTGQEGTTPDSNSHPSNISISHPDGKHSTQPAHSQPHSTLHHGRRKSTVMDSLALLAHAAWTDEGDKQLLPTRSTAMSKAMGDFLESQHFANQKWLEAIMHSGGRASYDALASTTGELQQLKNARMVLHHEFLECLARRRASRKRSWDESN